MKPFYLEEALFGREELLLRVLRALGVLEDPGVDTAEGEETAADEEDEVGEDGVDDEAPEVELPPDAAEELPLLLRQEVMA